MGQFKIKNFMVTIVIMLLYINGIQGMENQNEENCWNPNCKGKLPNYTVKHDDGKEICIKCVLMGIYNSAQRGTAEKLTKWPGNEEFKKLDQKQNDRLSDYNKDLKIQGAIHGIFPKNLHSRDVQPNFYKINDSDDFNLTIMLFMNNETFIKQLLDLRVSPEIQKNWIQHFVANEWNKDKISDEIWDFMASYIVDTPVCKMGHRLMQYEKGDDSFGHTCDSKKCNGHVTDGDFYCKKDNKCDYDICKRCLKLIEERTKMLKEVIPIYFQKRRIEKEMEPRIKKRDELQKEIDNLENELEELEKRELEELEKKRKY